MPYFWSGIVDERPPASRRDLTDPVIDLDRTKALRMSRPQLIIHLIRSTPAPFPIDMSRAFDLTHPMFATPFNQARQLQRQHPVVKRLVGFREMALVLDLSDDLHSHLRPLAVSQS